jgi:hypothetical protein
VMIAPPRMRRRTTIPASRGTLVTGGLRAR